MLRPQITKSRKKSDETEGKKITASTAVQPDKDQGLPFKPCLVLKIQTPQKEEFGESKKNNTDSCAVLLVNNPRPSLRLSQEQDIQALQMIQANAVQKEDRFLCLAIRKESKPLCMPSQEQSIHAPRIEDPDKIRRSTIFCDLQQDEDPSL